MSKNDRLFTAWEMRRDVHAWIAANPDCSMPEIKRNFIEVNPETVRWVVKRLRLAGLVVNEDNCYRVLRAFDQPADAARERLRDGGRASGRVRGMANANRTRNPDGTFAPVPFIDRLGKYVNRPASKMAIPNQGGQGASGAWRGGRSSLMMLVE